MAMSDLIVVSEVNLKKDVSNMQEVAEVAETELTWAGSRTF